MGDLSLEKVSETYLDVLKEIGNIGAGNAMTALSQMLNCKVDMKVPQVKLLDFNEVGALMGGEEQVMVGVFLGVEGDITGSMMFLVEQGSAKHLLHKIMGEMVQQEGFSEIAAVMRNIAVAEAYHEKRFLALAKDIKEGRMFMREKATVWRCRNCGCLVEGTHAPDLCPACAHPKAHFEELNYTF